MIMRWRLIYLRFVGNLHIHRIEAQWMHQRIFDIWFSDEKLACLSLARDLLDYRREAMFPSGKINDFHQFDYAAGNDKRQTKIAVMMGLHSIFHPFIWISWVNSQFELTLTQQLLSVSSTKSKFSLVENRRHWKISLTLNCWQSIFDLPT